MKIAARVIQDRNIRKNTESDFVANYKGCEINVSNDHGHGRAKYEWLTRYDITVTGKDGGYLVNTYEDLHTMRDAIICALNGAGL